MTFKQAPQPIHDGAILSILHLNGYKIANPTTLARISREELQSLFLGYGYKPYFVEGSDPEAMHQLIAKTLDWRKAPYRGTSHHPLLAILKKMPEAKR